MKIVLATTFRDFRGTDNDRIQYLFLDNLKRQTFGNFVVAVTTFGEKNVKDVVKQQLGDKVIIKDAEAPGEFRFSLTDVLLTGMDVAKQYQDDCVVVWCTCDVILKPDFFQCLAECFEPGFSGIVHPNYLYHSVGDMEQGIGVMESLGAGIDLLFFDATVLEKARAEIEEYRFLGWGVFEWFLSLVALKHARSRVNLLGLTSIGKIANNRKLTNEKLQYLGKCAIRNKKVLLRYIRDTGVVRRISDAEGLRCHLRYRLISPVEGYDDMVARASRFNLCAWLCGKVRSLYCRLLNSLH